MKNKQKGFTIVEALIVVLIVALLGFVGYYVWHSQHKTNPKTSASTSTSTQNPAKLTKTYTDDQIGYSFEYPKDWKFTVWKGSNKSDYVNGYPRYFNVVTIRTTNYKDKEVSSQTDGGPGIEVTQGGEFIIKAYSPPSKTSQSICQDVQKCVTIDGQKASQATYSPWLDGGYRTEDTFFKGMVQYEIIYSYAKDGQGLYLTAYNDLLASFKTNK